MSVKPPSLVVKTSLNKKKNLNTNTKDSVNLKGAIYHLFESGFNLVSYHSKQAI